MRSQNAKLRLHLINVATAGFMLSLPAIVAAQQSQSIYIPDPTPRPPDLQREYGDDPLQRAKEQQAAKLRKLMRMQEVISATNVLSVLAQELKNQVEKHDPGTPMAAEVVKLEQIEKLAKRVKETMKSR